MGPTKGDQTVVYKGRLRAGGDLSSGLEKDPIEMWLVSVDLDTETDETKLSPASTVKDPRPGKEDYFWIKFTVPHDFGEPGAFIIRSYRTSEIFLESLDLEAEGKSPIKFPILAWVYGHEHYPKDRVFFSSKRYLPSATCTPAGLLALRQQELEETRGDGKGMMRPWHRVYDYDKYNDLGDPDRKDTLRRHVLGGPVLPYPRRIRTGRPKSETDPQSETRPERPPGESYIPSDEFTVRTKNSTPALEYYVSFIKETLINHFHGTNTSFRSFDEISDIFKNGVPAQIPPSKTSGDMMYLNTILAPMPSNSAITGLTFPTPQVFAVDRTAWETDEEFGRQALAGLHASVIQLVTEYPPKSGLGKSSLTEDHILPYLEGLKDVSEAIKQRKLFIVDHHDAFLPYVNSVNADPEAGVRCYAPRTVFFLSSDEGISKLKPVAIELSLPPPKGCGHALDRVFTPEDDHLWELAKIHASSIDFNYHEILSHFTYCHAVMEPFIIASNRQLSKLHPIRTLLEPHFKDTLSINAAARQIIISAEGLIESTFSLGNHAFELGALHYGKSWQFNTQSAPGSLLARGMAAADESCPGSVKLVVDDYPWAKDGLEIWDALNKWVETYVNIVYSGLDDAVKNDTELQAWWDEIKNVGHGDLMNAKWWPELDSMASLVSIVTTICWIGGPFHASINFGQYAYGGYPLNKPSRTRRFIPHIDSDEYAELKKDPEKFILSTIASSYHSTLTMALLNLLASHPSDEEYIGELSKSTDWTDQQVKDAFHEFTISVAKVGKNIEKRNRDRGLFNRYGPAEVPYTLFFPTSDRDTPGPTGMGVPYSVSS